SILKTQKLANLAERQAVKLCQLDEPNTVEGCSLVKPEASSRATRQRHKAETLIVPQRVTTYPGLRRQLADLERSGFGHGRFRQYPLWSALQSQDSAR